MKATIEDHGYYAMIIIAKEDRKFNGIPVCHQYEYKSMVKGVVFGRFQHCGNNMNGWKAYNEYIAVDANTLEVIGVMNPEYGGSDYKTFRAEMLNR